jgi:arylsulfatase A-like enzyme
VALYDDVSPNLAALRASGFGPGEPRFEDLVTRYDAEIAATDAALEGLFAGLAELGTLDRTLVVITADHGEEFLEHDWVEHGWTLYEESLHVPLIFWAPGVLEPARVHARASHVDVVPSVLELLGVPREGSKVDGVPVFTIDADGTRPRDDERVQIAELLLAERQIMRAVLLDNWKYLATWQSVDPSERAEARVRAEAGAIDLWGSPVREEIYDLAGDPEERRNLVSTETQALDTLAAVLDKFRSAGPNYGFADNPPGSSAASDAERLPARGYGE